MVTKNNFNYFQKKIKILSSKILNLLAIKLKTAKKMSQSGATSLFVIFINTFNGNLYPQKFVVAISAGTSGPDETLRSAGSNLRAVICPLLP